MLRFRSRWRCSEPVLGGRCETLVTNLPETEHLPAFTVVITTYNRCDVLPRAMESVLRQSVGDLELIVVDDGSSDDTDLVVRSFDDPRVRYLKQSNQGLSAARNAGAALARAPWLAFLDDDDEAVPGWLDLLHRELEHECCGIACCGRILVDETGRELACVLPGDLGAPYDHQVGSFMAGTFAVRTDIFSEVGGYAVGLQSTHGTELAFRLIPHCLERGFVVRSVARAGVRVEDAPRLPPPSEQCERAVLRRSIRPRTARGANRAAGRRRSRTTCRSSALPPRDWDEIAKPGSTSFVRHARIPAPCVAG